MTTTLRDLQKWKTANTCTLDISSKIVGSKLRLGDLKDILPTAIQHLTITSEKISKVTYIDDDFLRDCDSLVTLDITQLTDVARVGRRFLKGCSALKKVDLSPLSKVTRIHREFLEGCSGLETVDLSPLKNVTEVVNEFLCDCSSLQKVDLTPLKNATQIGERFLDGCSAITHLDLSPLSNVTDIGKQFLGGCKLLATLDLSPLSNTTKIGSKFLDDCRALKKVDLTPLCKITDVGDGFLSGCSALTELNLTPLGEKVGSFFLSDCSSLQSIDLTPLENTSIVDGGMLSGCGSLKTLDLSPLRNITQIGAGFLSGCSALRELNLSPMNEVKQIGIRFLADCESLEDVNLSSLKGITKIGDEFLSGCSALKLLDLTPLSEVTEIGNKFLAQCDSLEVLDLRPLSKVTQIGGQFLDRCSNLETLDLSPLSGVTEVGAEFLDGCGELKSLNLSPLSKVTRIGKSFLKECDSIDSVVYNSEVVFNAMSEELRRRAKREGDDDAGDSKPLLAPPPQLRSTTTADNGSLPSPPIELMKTIEGCNKLIEHYPDRKEGYTCKAALMLSSPSYTAHEDEINACIDKSLKIDDQYPDAMDTLAALAVQSRKDPIERLGVIEKIVDKAVQDKHPVSSKQLIDVVDSILCPNAYEGITVEFLDSLLQHVNNFENNTTQGFDGIAAAISRMKKEMVSKSVDKSLEEDVEIGKLKVTQSCADMKKKLQERKDEEEKHEQYLRRIRALEYKLFHLREKAAMAEKISEKELARYLKDLEDLKKIVADKQNNVPASHMIDGYCPEGKGAGDYYNMFIKQLSGTFTEVLRAHSLGVVPGGESSAAKNYAEHVKSLLGMVPWFGDAANILIDMTADVYDGVAQKRTMKRLYLLLDLGINTTADFDRLMKCTGMKIMETQEKTLNKLSGVKEVEERKSLFEMLQELPGPVDLLVNFIEKDVKKTATESWGRADATLLTCHLQTKSVAENLTQTCAHGRSGWYPERMDRVAQSLARVVIEKKAGRMNRMVNLRIKKCTSLPSTLSVEHLKCTASCGGYDGITGFGQVHNGEVNFNNTLYLTIIDDTRGSAETVEFSIPGVGTGTLQLKSVVVENGKLCEGTIHLGRSLLHVNIVTVGFKEFNLVKKVKNVRKPTTSTTSSSKSKKKKSKKPPAKDSSDCCVC
eukprot:TRINITY_DN1715_c0_g2_i2.p1 TRINITY_DN1715_c0_g2~~TRINITY_DN1715_c0_g2_i2.p1  ORF type:complete len:1161 (+),score=211.39 TRINITY_DN1715_c0_g2_i2:47-3529(+)